MHYPLYITVPASTEEENLITQSFSMPYGVIEKVSLLFPWGSGGLLRIAIFHNDRKIFPSNADKWYIGNDIVIEFETSYVLEESFNSISIRGYNEDDTFEHSCYGYIALSPNQNNQELPIPVIW